MGEAELLDGLREAVDRQVLLPEPGGDGYIFRHALVAEAVMASCFPASGSASIPRWPVRWRPASAPGTLRRPGRRASPTTGRQPATSPAP
jgi:hypothetical protein